QKLADDKALALRTIDETGEDNLTHKPAPAPWDPRPVPLGRRMLGMVQHLSQHKDQLFYYLKLQGKPVTTHTLYGMTP
ncbi:MAG: DinB family protein, partial [Planctomycetota bacterium]|nr:DinB family protein [Planctomycetota bacterium]